MKVWILLILALILLVWGIRERFDTSPQCPSGFIQDRLTPDGALRCKKAVAEEPKCPDGYTMTPFVAVPGTNTGTGGTCEKGGESTVARCPDDTYLSVIDDKQVCVEYEFVRPQSSTAGGTAGGTTGGSSTTSAGPTTRQSGARGVFGPEFGGFGQGSTGNPHRDSTKTNTYPELLGGGDSKPKTLVDGAGLVDPSKNWQLANDGSLPNCIGLGCDENSKYLPYSRQPGDMDLIPDPYRVSQSYMNSSYSFKTEPTPFLTDFSAFLR